MVAISSYRDTVIKKVEISSVEDLISRQFPLIIYLHGLGADGAIRDGSFSLRELMPEKYKNNFNIIYPLAERDKIFDPESIVYLRDIYLNDVKPRDSRVYLIGHSMGARGVWDCACEYPYKFTAVVALSGFGHYISAPQMKQLPSLTIHDRKDTVVPFDESYKMYSTLSSCNSKLHKLYVTKTVGHGTVGFLKTDLIYKWMLQY